MIEILFAKGAWGVGVGRDGEMVIFTDRREKAQELLALASNARVIVAERPVILVADLWDKYGYKYTKIAKSATQPCSCHRSRCRPLQAGTSICDCELTACSSTGPFVDSAGQLYWVTNAHCTKATATCNRGDLLNRPMTQPAPYDGGRCPNDEIGKTVKASDIFRDGYTDTALIPIDPSMADTLIHGTNIRLNGKFREPQVGETVIKSGRTTGVQKGTVLSVRTTVRVDYGCLIRTVYNTIVTTKILEPGDSGSVVVTQDGTFVGQGFAGSPSVSVLVSPEEIYREFGIVPWSGEPQPTPTPTPPPRKPTPTEIKVKLVVKSAEGEEVVLKTDKDVYESPPGGTVQIAVYANYKQDNAPVDGYRVYAKLGDKATYSCLSNGVATIQLTAPTEPGEYDVTVGITDQLCTSQPTPTPTPPPPFDLYRVVFTSNNDPYPRYLIVCCDKDWNTSGCEPWTGDCITVGRGVSEIQCCPNAKYVTAVTSADAGHTWTVEIYNPRGELVKRCENVNRYSPCSTK